MTNQNDPVPAVPPLPFGYTHSAGEVHIVDGSQTNVVSCPGHDNEHCAAGNSLLHVSLANHFGWSLFSNVAPARSLIWVHIFRAVF